VLWGGTLLRLGREDSSPKFTHIAGAVTAQVLKIGSGRLCRFVLNSLASGTTITIYDAVTATNPIAVIDPGSGGTRPTSVEYNCDFFTGLCVTTVNASTDITIIYE
jgi:hypothetical protein